MILACNKIEKAFGERTIIKSGSFHIEDQEKVALVGLNGAGKSTILKMIIGEESLDSGTITITKDKTIGYLSQHQSMESENTIFEEVASAKAHIKLMEKKLREQEEKITTLEGDELEEELIKYNHMTLDYESANGYAYKSEIIGVLKGLSFNEEEFNLKVKTLSGGQKTRVSLGKLLLMNPDILLLDEPTNHLDINSISWLENYLASYRGAVLIVSHDRYFLNRVVSKVVEIEDLKITMYRGNYHQFAEKKEILREMKVKEYIKQQQEIKHQKEVIEKLKSFNREKSIKRAESREKLLSKIEEIDKPIAESSKMNINLEPNITSGKDVLNVFEISKSYDNKKLFDNTNFKIQRGERVAVIGDNGTGKSTLLKIINGKVSNDSGEIAIGTNVHIGYYDQEYAVLNIENTIFEEIHNAYPTLTHIKIRNTLAAFLFTGDDVYKQIKTLSGGEKGRVSLAKLMLSESNFLILDEPTNHLDITSKEILEHALRLYTGTILYVSHDRYFVNETATRILELKEEIFTNYIGNYDYYLEKKNENIEKNDKYPKKNSNKSEAKESWQAKKELEAARRKKKNELQRVEEEIHFLEDKDKEINEALTLEEVYTDMAKCKELSVEKEKIKESLAVLYERWEVLSEEI